LCFVRIGMALTGAILTGLGVSIGVTLPMIVKGSGLFQQAADLTSPAGLAVLAGVAVMLAGVVCAALAGFGRDRALQKQEQRSGSFLGGLIMSVIAGVLSCGMSLSFVYGQGPIIEAMKKQGAGEIPATFAVWAVGLLGGSVLNVVYPACLMTRKKSWGVLCQSWKELMLAVIIGLPMTIGIVFMGKGMVMLGALGASVGFGIQQASQMLGSQAVGFISGEWKGVCGRPRNLMYAAIVVLILAAVIMAYGNSLAKA
jgi:L-rhamnose-H+ transport protein